ncbi:hypothetical protein F4814DRAFT_421340 [Daldinia grandis]|nr:hypothetical protein F4814DRAFT_421340 [Daldinia grandis]
MATLPKQPAQATGAAKREAKRQATKVIKRRKTLIGKSHNFHKDCGFEVLLLLQKGRRSYAYTSPGMPFWPPIAEYLMQRLPFPTVYTATEQAIGPYRVEEKGILEAKGIPQDFSP